MTVRFEQRIATNRLAHFGTLRDRLAHFTIHENGNTRSSPYDEAAFVRNGGGAGKVMYHFAVGVEGADDTPTIVQIFPANKRGKHAGNAEGNATSLAVEVCQAPPGATSAATQKALQELLHMVYTRDPRIDWGGGNHVFSPDRTRGHKDWPGANPGCPATMTKLWGGVEPVVAVARKRLEDTSPAPAPVPKPDLLPFLFGQVKWYRFDPNGPVSRAWLTRGKETGLYPRLVDVLEVDGRKWFAFASGAVAYAEPGKPVVWLTDIAA